jgi:hypothetical protein
MFGKIRLYNLVMQGINAIITNQMPKFHVFKPKVFSSVQVTTLSTVCHFVLKYLARKGNIQTDTKKFNQNTHFGLLINVLCLRKTYISGESQYRGQIERKSNRKALCTLLLHPACRSSYSNAAYGIFTVFVLQ